MIKEFLPGDLVIECNVATNKLFFRDTATFDKGLLGHPTYHFAYNI
jgi:hypothetical protein